jgi:hypothetical protein
MESCRLHRCFDDPHHDRPRIAQRLIESRQHLKTWQLIVDLFEDLADERLADLGVLSYVG